MWISVGRAFPVEEASSKAFEVGVCVMFFFGNNEGVCSGWIAGDEVSMIRVEQIAYSFACF